MDWKTQDNATETAASGTITPETKMFSTKSDSSSPILNYGSDVAGISSESLQHLTPSGFSDVIDMIGMGPFQMWMILMCGTGFAIDAIEIIVVSFVLEDVAISFDLSAVGKGVIGSASFLGMLVGAGFWSVYADKRGRRSAFVLSLAFMFFGGVLSAASPSLLGLCICRVAVGFGVGGNLPVTITLLMEFLPTGNRAYVLCRIGGTFWGMGIIVASVLGYILTNVLGSGQEDMFWRWFLGVAALPSAVVAIAYKLLPESPRFLHAMGRNDEALKVLERVARKNGKLDLLALGFSGQRTSENSHTAVPESPPNASASTTENDFKNKATQAQGENLTFARLHNGEQANYTAGCARSAQGAEAGDVRELFHTPILRRVTLCVWAFWLFLNLSYYGATFLLPIYFSKITGGQRGNLYILFILVGIFYIPGAWLSMHLCSEQCLGRVGSMKWSSFATAALFLLMATATGTSIIFIIVALLTLSCIAIPGTLVYLIVPELYSTKYRTVGLGSASVVNRLGGLVAPLLAEILYEKWGAVAPLLFFGPMMIFTGIASALIPVETAGRKLDDDSWDRITPNADAMEDAFVVSGL